MTRIGFTGPYADINFGDYAMLVNNIAGLDLRGATIFSYDDAFLSRVIPEYFVGFRSRVVGVELDPLEEGRGLTDRSITSLEVLALVRNEDEIRDALSELDVLVVNGGGYLNELWCRPHRQMRLLQILAPAFLAAEMGKRVVFSANGVGPFGRSLDAMANLLAGLPSSTLHVRDQLYSPMWARRLGVAEQRICHVPDDLLVIDDALQSRLPRISSPRTRPYVVVETYTPVDRLADELPRWETFVDVMDRRHGMDTVFMPLHLGAGGVDQAQLLGDALGIDWVDIRPTGYLPVEDAVALISGAELVVSGRYHALVLALAARTPVLSVVREVAGDLGYYFSKNAGVLEVAIDTPVRVADYLVTSSGEAFARAEDRLEDVLSQARSSGLGAGDAVVVQRQHLLDHILGG